jgi:hypothetical protein
MASVMQQRCRDEPTIRIAKAKAEKQKPGARPGFLRNISFRQLTSSAHVISSLGELGDLMRQARHLAARIVAVNDVVLRRLH